MTEEQPVPPPSVSRLRAFLETRQLVDNPVAVISKHLFERGDTFYYPIGGIKKVLITIDPKVLRYILNDNYENYHHAGPRRKHMIHFLGANLVTSHGDYWLRQRRLIQPGFRGDKLASMAAAMCSCLEESLTRFDEEIRRGPVDICPQMVAMTLRMVACSLFSARLSDEDFRLISQAISQILAFIVRQIVQPFLIPWLALSGEFRRHEVMRSEVDKFLIGHIRRRRTEHDQKDDLLQILLDARYGDTGEGMTDEQILSESKLFIVAGHETTSIALCWTLYLLSQYPDHLRRAREELKAVVGDGPFRFSHCASLPLTRRIIEESLRLYPPFWMVDRVALKDDRAGDVPIPKGTTIIAFIHGAHRAPAFWRDPHDFLPERFDDDRKIRLDFHYLPFGGGPRGCIGNSFAMLEMLMILNVILRRYDFALASDEVVESRPEIVLRPRNGIIMRFERLRGDET
jgi:cytochrome P450